MQIFYRAREVLKNEKKKNYLGKFQEVRRNFRPNLFAGAKISMEIINSGKQYPDKRFFQFLAI